MTTMNRRDPDGHWHCPTHPHADLGPWSIHPIPCPHCTREKAQRRRTQAIIWTLTALTVLALLALAVSVWAHEPRCADGYPHGLPTTVEHWDSLCSDRDCLCVEQIQVFAEKPGYKRITVKHSKILAIFTGVPEHLVFTSQNHEEYVCVPGGVLVSDTLPYQEYYPANEYYEEDAYDLNFIAAFVQRGGQ